MPPKKRTDSKQHLKPGAGSPPASSSPASPAQAVDTRSRPSTRPDLPPALSQPEQPTAPQAVDPVVETLARLEDLRVKTQARLDDLDRLSPSGADEQKQVQSAQETLNDLLDAISEEKTVINQQAIAEHTISLAAAEAAIDPGIKQLEELRNDLAEIAKNITEVAEIITGVDSALEGARSILAGVGA